MGLIGKLKSIFHEIADIVYKIFGETAVEALKAKIKTLLSEDLTPIFFDAVNWAQKSVSGSGADKRAAAFAKLVVDLKAAGHDLPTATINLGIELVVTLLKANWVA